MTTQAPAPTGSSRSLMQFALRLREAGVLVFLIVLGLTFTLLSPQFLTVQNLTVVASSASILAIAACAQAIVLFTKNLDVSVGSIMGMVAYLTADYAANHPGITPVELLHEGFWVHTRECHQRTHNTHRVLELKDSAETSLDIYRVVRSLP